MKSVSKDKPIFYRFGVTRDERGIESQTDEGIAQQRHDEKWEAEGEEQETDE